MRALLLALAVSLLAPAAAAQAPAARPVPAQGVAAAAASAAAPVSLDERRRRADEAYHKGDLAAAIAGYQHILSYGVRSADVEHGLGNALLRAGQVGEAILHYQRALRLEPRAADTRHNLELARGRLAEGSALELVRKGIEVGEGSDAERVAFFRSLTRNEAAAALLLLNLLACGLVFLVLRLPKGGTARTVLGWASGLLVALTLLNAGYVAGQAWVEHEVRLGVALRTVAVRESPAPEAQVLFRAPEGLTLRLDPSPVPGWRSIRVNDELHGFAPEDALAPIDLPTEAR